MNTINEIKNSTLAKLTLEEAQLFGLANMGFGFYKGDLKTRHNGIRRKSDDGVTFTYENETLRLEFTELISEDDERHWAARMFNKKNNSYETYPMGIIGCDFIR